MKSIQIQQAKNGYIVQNRNEYGIQGEAELFVTFIDLAKRMAERFGETGFATTVEQSQTLATAFGSLCQSALAPQLLAIQAQVNPGIENVAPAKSVADDDLFN